MSFYVHPLMQNADDDKPVGVDLVEDKMTSDRQRAIAWNDVIAWRTQSRTLEQQGEARADCGDVGFRPLSRAEREMMRCIRAA